jgi:hypothetical protein
LHARRVATERERAAHLRLRRHRDDARVETLRDAAPTTTARALPRRSSGCGKKIKKRRAME